MAPELYISTSSLPYARVALATICWMLEGSRVSTGMARAAPPEEVISRATVLMVEEGELGSGGNGLQVEASDVVFAATTTAMGPVYPLDIGW